MLQENREIFVVTETFAEPSNLKLRDPIKKGTLVSTRSSERDSFINPIPNHSQKN